VVAGDSGGAPDAVLDGENGFVVDGRSPEQVADRVGRLLADHDLAERFGVRGRAWVTQQWGWQAQADRLVELLEPR
jgi:phosphatidylinositol alpha-1,6-mannosyltransferase